MSDNSVGGLFAYLCSELTELYEERESTNIAVEIFQGLFGLSRVDLVLKAGERLSESQIVSLFRALKELRKLRPVQYILGKAHFMGLELLVDERVLIPRPETEELVNWIIESYREKYPRLLDIGTGSGCIALALKSKFPNATIHACDVMPKALELASKNAQNLGLNVEFHEGDILEGEPELGPYDIIVSNPPYIPPSDKNRMWDNVTAFEPDVALFTPDDDPLIFYRAIAGYCTVSLKEGGWVYVEVHEDRAEKVVEVFDVHGLVDVEVKLDMQNRPRMVRARRKE